jgi:hypothetical protein
MEMNLSDKELVHRALLPNSECEDDSSLRYQQRHRFSRRFFGFAILVSLALTWSSLSEYQRQHVHDVSASCSAHAHDAAFDWDSVRYRWCNLHINMLSQLKVIPSETLVWLPCEEKYQCARLSVGLPPETSSSHLNHIISGSS